MREINPVPEITCGTITAAVYEGAKGTFYIRVNEPQCEAEVCLDATEAAALKNFLSAALGFAASDAKES